MEQLKERSQRQSNAVNVRSWAVGHIETSARVALRLNEYPPFLLKVEEARAIAEALQGEAHRFVAQKKQ